MKSIMCDRCGESIECKRMCAQHVRFPNQTEMNSKIQRDRNEMCKRNDVRMPLGERNQTLTLVISWSYQDPSSKEQLPCIFLNESRLFLMKTRPRGFVEYETDLAKPITWLSGNLSRVRKSKSRCPFKCCSYRFRQSHSYLYLILPW